MSKHQDHVRVRIWVNLESLLISLDPPEQENSPKAHEIKATQFIIHKNLLQSLCCRLAPRTPKARAANQFTWSYTPTFLLDDPSLVCLWQYFPSREWEDCSLKNSWVSAKLRKGG